VSNRKYSKKREAVLEKLQSTTSHPSAEWIYHELKSDYPEISLATVYRNLNMFREDGEIISLGAVKGQERFDARTAQHDHFICESCGAILDIMPSPDSASSEELHVRYSQIAPDLNVTISKHHVSYYGECKGCNEKK